MWEIRVEGVELALYFMGEYQFRMTRDEAKALEDTLQKYLQQ